MAPEMAAPPKGIRPRSGGGVHEHSGTPTVARHVTDGKEGDDVRTAHVRPAPVDDDDDVAAILGLRR